LHQVEVAKPLQQGFPVAIFPIFNDFRVLEHRLEAAAQLINVINSIFEGHTLHHYLDRLVLVLFHNVIENFTVEVLRH
jgi:hypothetical protein